MGRQAGGEAGRAPDPPRSPARASPWEGKGCPEECRLLAHEHRQGRTRKPSRGPASDSQRTYRCSVGSAAPCWSLPFGILWSITIVSVFAKQNPLDLMISENETMREVTHKGLKF